MKACIILHNIIIEDERGENVTEGFFHYEQEEENPHIVLPEKTSCFIEFIRGHQHIKDQEAHSRLQSDLVEHIWQLKGES
jgi:hypothetical protein